jgi:predicted amidohydrolase
VAGIYERAETAIYNTAILVGRDGGLVGSYRKTHLPREEFEGGLMPGDCYPVFETDFARVGIMICWDLQFPEVARALALRGAEVILLPIWGGNEALAYARAIENYVFLVTASYDMRSFILDPTGAILAEATPQFPLAVAQLHLDRKLMQPWIGDMRNRTWKERRPDLVVDVAP